MWYGVYVWSCSLCSVLQCRSQFPWRRNVSTIFLFCFVLQSFVRYTTLQSSAVVLMCLTDDIIVLPSFVANVCRKMVIYLALVPSELLWYNECSQLEKHVFLFWKRTQETGIRFQLIRSLMYVLRNGPLSTMTHSFVITSVLYFKSRNMAHSVLESVLFN
jgi:hypothetical protein